MYRPNGSNDLKRKIRNIVTGGFVPQSWDLGSVFDFSGLFSEIQDFTNLAFIENWDVSNVTNMAYMFSDCSSFNLRLNNWNVKNVTNMEYMFSGCSSFNQPLDNWNVTNVTNMAYMFSGCSSFNQPLNNWNVSNVTNMSHMFSGCSLFNQPLDNWDVSNVTNMAYMFSDCSSFNQPLNNWSINENADQRFMLLGSNTRVNIEPPAMSLEERTRRTQEIKDQMARAAEEPDLREKKPFPYCGICHEYLNNIEGPGQSERCQKNCDDVVNVCVNNHLFHRGCILNWCNAGSVDVASQIGFPQYSNLQPLSKATKCPLCDQDLLPSCEGLREKERVSTENINENGLINKGGKGRKIYGKSRKVKKSKVKKSKTKKNAIKRKTKGRPLKGRKTHKK